MLHHFGLNAKLLLISNSAYSSSFCSHSLMLTEWGCDSICVGCKTGMIVELGICVFSDAIIEDYTSPSSHLKMTQHIITVRPTHATLSAKRTGATKDEIIIDFFFWSRHVTELSMPVLSLHTIHPFCLITEMNGPLLLSCCNLLDTFHALQHDATVRGTVLFGISGLCNISMQRQVPVQARGPIRFANWCRWR